jgi:hypothetical protein
MDALIGAARPPAPVESYLRVVQIILRQQAAALCNYYQFPLDIYEVAAFEFISHSYPPTIFFCL